MYCSFNNNGTKHCIRVALVARAGNCKLPTSGDKANSRAPPGRRVISPVVLQWLSLVINSGCANGQTSAVKDATRVQFAFSKLLSSSSCLEKEAAALIEKSSSSSSRGLLINIAPQLDTLIFIARFYGTGKNRTWMRLIAGICCVGAPNCNKELAGTDLN